MSKPVGEAGLALIKRFEGCRLTAYKPVSTEKYWTIVWGHYGPDVREGQVITQTQADAIPAQHTDFIFAVIGEELGFLGCVLCIALLVAIVLRIIYIGVHSQSYFYRQICVGIAGMLLFQILVNIGMVIGLTPVIGLTLPFFSYGGSSMLSMFIAMGVISSINMHPSPDSQQRYIQLPV